MFYPSFLRHILAGTLKTTNGILKIIAGVPVTLNESTYVRVALNTMPPIYFHGNYNRYNEHNNTI
jgi:hypothetical protein